MRTDVTWVSDVDLIVGGRGFHCGYPVMDPPEGYLPVMKNRQMLDAYVDLIERDTPELIFELGIRRGGSAALLHRLADPRRLVAIDLAPRPAEALTAYIDQEQAADVIRPHYGVDQSDRGGLFDLLERELGGGLLDLVVDDASHLYEPTVASFDVLFPRLRPGGRYVIEDWNTGHRLADAIGAALEDGVEGAAEGLARMTEGGIPKRSAPLSRLILEMVLLRASDGDIIRDIRVDEHWTVVTRGEASLAPERFRFRDHVRDHFSLLGPA